jgi:AcrR family transcriptional regulator
MSRISASARTATRRRLVEAATSEFADRGLAGARFDAISLAAGNAKGTIYNYFPSKEALFLTVVAEWCSHLVEAYERLDHDSAGARLLSIARLDTEVARSDPDLARVVVQQMPSLVGSHREAAHEAIRPGVDLLSEVFADGLGSGEFTSPHPPATLARLFLGILSAFELEALAPDPGVTLDDVVVLVEEHFIRGLAA